MKGSDGGVVDPAARDKYLLRVTAGPSYDTSTHTEVAVNSADAHLIDNDLMTCYLKVRIRDYHGLPRNSPPTSNYFQHTLHTNDRYSIGFAFVPKQDIKGSDLVTGFDFDHSIKDRLPPGFRYAMKIVTTILDPGIFSDPYSDKPYLYGPALSSFFAFRVGEHTTDVPLEEQLKAHDDDCQGVIEEGAEGSGQRIRADQKIPSKTSKRRKNFLDPKKLENFTFEAGRMYQADFFNPYLDFANFALRIPGFSISVVRYIDDKTHALRYVLKNRSTDEVLFVVIFNLLFGQSLEDTLDSEVKKNANSTSKEVPENIDSAVEEETSDFVDAPEQLATSSSTSSSHSRSNSTPLSEAEDSERETRRDKATAASTLATSIYSGFAALGFGRGASTSSSDTSRTSVSLTRTQGEERKILEKKIDEMDDSAIEEYLKKSTSRA